MLELFVLKNATERMRQHLNWTVGARVMVIFALSVARALGRSVGQTVARSLDRSLDRSVAQSLGRWIAVAIARATVIAAYAQFLRRNCAHDRHLCLRAISASQTLHLLIILACLFCVYFFSCLFFVACLFFVSVYSCIFPICMSIFRLAFRIQPWHEQRPLINLH